MQNGAMQECIDECLRCYRTCRETAMQHCLEEGGRHVEPDHFRLLSSCAEICRTAADFMISGARGHEQVCGACAEICDECAQSCDEVGGMDECVQTCRRCARQCREMAAPPGEAGRPQSRQSAGAQRPM